jgi:hypothetical protein
VFWGRGGGGGFHLRGGGRRRGRSTPPPPNSSSLPQRWKRMVSRFLSQGSSFFFLASFKLMFLMLCFSGRYSQKSAFSLVFGLV